MSVRNGSQLTGVPWDHRDTEQNFVPYLYAWDLRLAGHTSATHTFLVLSTSRFRSFEIDHDYVYFSAHFARSIDWRNKNRVHYFSCFSLEGTINEINPKDDE